MKKILFLATILLANISCQEEEINTQIEPSVPQSKNLQIVQITNQGEIIPINGTTTRSSVEGELALQFISESDYQSTITEISHMTAKERLEYVDNFISLQKLANEADMELDEIGAVATSEADFRTKYAQYVEKYSEKLITNKYDVEDLTLYVPDGDNLSTYLINENKKVVIGNEVKEISLNNDMSSSEKAVFAADTRAGATNQFTFKETKDGKKTTGSVTLEASSGIFVHVGCQKKLWYGWRRDTHRDIFFQLSASPMYYTLPNAIGEPYRLNSVQYHAFHDNGGDYKFATGGLQPGNRILSGNLRVWTDMMVNTADSVLYKYVYVNYEGKKYGNFGDHKLPRLDNNKAYGGSFTLTMP